MILMYYLYNINVLAVLMYYLYDINVLFNYSCILSV